MWFEVLVCIPLLFFLWLLLQGDPPAKCGVYTQPGRWYYLKCLVFRVMLYLRRRKQKLHCKSSGYGQKSHSSSELMEQPQVLGEHPMSIDAVYFNGMDKDGTCFVLRLGRRHNRRAEIWLSIRLSDGSFYQSPAHPDTVVYNTDGMTFSAAGLKMECVEPMRRWRVSYNGLLRKGLCNDYTEDKGKTVHVSFSFMWTTFSDVFDFDTDIDVGLLTAACAREKWTKSFWDTLTDKHQTHYEQWGELHGTVKVEGQEDRHLHLRGCRDHSYGIRDWRMFHRYIVHFGYLEDGTTFHINTLSWTGGLTYLQCGYVSLPNATMVPMTSTDMDLAVMGENHNPPDQYNFSFTAGGKTYNATVNCTMCPIYYNHEDWGNVIYEKYAKYEVNGVKGYGIAEFCYRRYNSTSPVPQLESLPLLKEPVDISTQDHKSLVLAFTHSACSSSRLVGGKGCQLGLLTQLGSKSFVVPQGFCVTLTAFQQQLQANKELLDCIQTLEDISSGKVSGSIESACSAVHSAFVGTELAAVIRPEITAELIRQFGSDHTEKMFAVRSSAAGEDSVEMSAAGQMDTFLGVKGSQQIFEAICKCWASQFSQIAVEYRRQHGQPILCGMGVVIQEMVPAQAAGVLFTHDPVTGSPARMVLNANYGLGESVVSGEAEPDTVIINRTWDDTVSVGDKEIGRKKRQMHLAESGGVESMDLAEDGAATCCLSDDIIIRLAEIGIMLEKYFSNPRDIEFAVKDGIIYLLQARPITSLDQESEWDLLHEFDSGFCNDTEINTTCNIGEMMPSAMTPLTLSTFYHTIDHLIQRSMAVANVIPKPHDFNKFGYSYNNMGFLNIHMMMSLSENSCLGMDKKMGELNVLGETLDDFTMEEVMQYHGPRPLYERIRNSFKYWRGNLGNATERLKYWDKELLTYTIAGHDWPTAKELYTHIAHEYYKFDECWETSLSNSSSSGIWSVVLMNVLSKGEPVWTTEYYSDVAMMLGTCEDVYSADVPAALQKLVTELRESGQGDHLVSLSAQEAAAWLLSDKSGDAGKSMKQFFSRHGHRCVKEAEFLEKSWQTEPQKVTSVIQAMLANAPVIRENKATISVAETIKNIKTPITTIGRLVLRWALPRARNAVGRREWGKSVAVKMQEVFKQGYWKLAKLMVLERRLPREELLFFLTHREIGQLLETRSGRLVARAQRRCKIYPKQVDMKYERISRGHPVLIEDTDTEEDFVITSLKLKGMPVSVGIVRGKARVVKTLQEASSIKPGEILIVPFTDVGWSPYFPMISGLVTEIGGLLSHGAVVAREYGLPCVVKIQKATSLFKTGDDVILNGTAGILEKVDNGGSGSSNDDGGSGSSNDDGGSGSIKA